MSESEIIALGLMGLLIIIIVISNIKHKGFNEKKDKFLMSLAGGFNKTTDIFRAVRDNDFKTVINIINEKDGLNIKDDLGRTPLHEAAYYGIGEMVELLLAKGFYVNTKDSTGSTPLHEAAMAFHDYKDYKGVIIQLLSKGADINERDNCGATPLRIALTENRLEIIDLLRSYGGEE